MLLSFMRGRQMLDQRGLVPLHQTFEQNQTPNFAQHTNLERIDLGKLIEQARDCRVDVAQALLRKQLSGDTRVARTFPRMKLTRDPLDSHGCVQVAQFERVESAHRAAISNRQCALNPELEMILARTASNSREEGGQSKEAHTVSGEEAGAGRLPVRPLVSNPTRLPWP